MEQSFVAKIVSRETIFVFFAKIVVSHQQRRNMLWCPFLALFTHFLISVKIRLLMWINIRFEE